MLLGFLLLSNTNEEEEEKEEEQRRDIRTEGNCLLEVTRTGLEEKETSFSCKNNAIHVI